MKFSAQIVKKQEVFLELMSVLVILKITNTKNQREKKSEQNAVVH